MNKFVLYYGPSTGLICDECGDEFLLSELLILDCML